MVKMERSNNAIRNIVFGLISKLYQMIIPFLMRTLIIQFFGVEYLGLNSLFVSVLQILNLMEFGVGSAMVYSMYKPIAENDSQYLCALLALYNRYYRIIGTVVGIIGLILLPFLPQLIHGDVPSDVNVYILYLINLATTVMSYWLFAYKSSILQAHQRLDITSKVLLVTDTFKIIIQFVAIVIFRDYYIYSLGVFLAQVLTNLITAYAVAKTYPELNPKGELSNDVVIEIKTRIKDVFTSKIGGVIINSADSVVISAFLGLTALALYQNYYYIMTMVFAFVLIGLEACVAGIGNSLVTESMEKNYSDFKGLSFITNWICCICICCFLNMYQPFMKLWVGEELLLPFSMVILFCIYFYLHTITNFFCIYKNASGIWHEDRYRPLVGSLLNIVLNLCFVKTWGLFSIILSTILSYILVITPWLIVNLFKLLFKRGIREYVFQLLRYIVVTFICCMSAYALGGLITFDGLEGLSLKAIISVAVGIIAYGVFFIKTNEFKYFILVIKKIFKFFNARRKVYKR